mgnify:CR=1 FL=1
MSVENNDLPAFPCEWDYISSTRAEANGMLLRDYFAAHCPITIEDAGNFNRGYTGDFMDFYAKIRIQYADAMLKARQS